MTGPLDQILEEMKQDKPTLINLTEIESLHHFIEQFRLKETDEIVAYLDEHGLSIAKHVYTIIPARVDFFVMTDSLGHKVIFSILGNDTIGTITKGWEVVQ